MIHSNTHSPAQTRIPFKYLPVLSIFGFESKTQWEDQAWGLEIKGFIPACRGNLR